MTGHPSHDAPQRVQVLVTVKAYPQLSHRSGEVVCVAGVRLGGDRSEWIRLFPSPSRSATCRRRHGSRRTTWQRAPWRVHVLCLDQLRKCVGPAGPVATDGQLWPSRPFDLDFLFYDLDGVAVKCDGTAMFERRDGGRCRCSTWGADQCPTAGRSDGTRRRSLSGRACVSACRSRPALLPSPAPQADPLGLRGHETPRSRRAPGVSSLICTSW